MDAVGGGGSGCHLCSTGEQTLSLCISIGESVSFLCFAVPI